MAAFGPARQFFDNEVFDTPTATRPTRAYRVIGDPSLVIVIYDDQSATTGPATLVVGCDVLNIASYPGFVEKAPKPKLRPWLLFERPFEKSTRKLSAAGARHGHQQMCRLPNYRGTRTR